MGVSWVLPSLREHTISVTVVLEPLDWRCLFSHWLIFMRSCWSELVLKHPTWEESSHLSLGYSSPLNLNLVDISKATFHSNLLLVAKWKLFVSQDREIFYWLTGKQENPWVSLETSDKNATIQRRIAWICTKMKWENPFLVNFALHDGLNNKWT